MNQPWALDVSSLPKELRYMLRLLRSDYPLDEDEAMQLAGDIDWPLFLRLALYHETFPVLYPILLRLNARQQWTPDFVMANLLTPYTRNTHKLLQLQEETGRLGGLLESNGVRALFLTGITGDLNILVSKQDANVMEQQLGTETELNICWSFSPDSRNAPSFEELWVRRQASSLQKSVFTLGNEDRLLHLIMNGTRTGCSSLKWLLDLDKLMGEFLNWNRMNQLFEQSKSKLIGGQAFLLSTQLLGTLLPEEAYNLTLESKARRLAQMSIPLVRGEQDKTLESGKLPMKYVPFLRIWQQFRRLSPKGEAPLQ
ncbi:nucleotidyltransferase family protein [Paenibacillus glycanilyticus]|uniref:Nucleotidyltransferase family protein n=1 Tax=Paenibacillus glycanilyticus TaxID=126569 RepID=A0ABQ6G9P3_9BACL|nr:nucleotidyltransferase family protein [Paenibacillus glycanilyticus]GLX67684.1 hypothetical protein MU1_20290 [Paenibacillus glycanilyticus]